MKINFQEFIDLLNQEEGFEIWDMKTSVVNIIERFYYKCIRIFDKNLDTTMAFQLEEIKEDEKNAKIAFVANVNNNNNNNLIPKDFSFKTEEFASTSAARQYLDVLTSFGIIKPAREFYIKSSNWLPNGIFKIRNDILNFRNKEELFENCFNSLIKNSINNDFKSRRFLYTIIVGWTASKFDNEYSGDDYLKIKQINLSCATYKSIKEIKEIIKNLQVNFFIEQLDFLAMTDEEIINKILKINKIKTL